MLCAVTLIDRISQALTSGPATVVIEPPGTGPGFWAGGPSVVNTGGDYHLAYRLRRPVDQGRGYANVVACGLGIGLQCGHGDPCGQAG